jgi:hypothetical protein
VKDEILAIVWLCQLIFQVKIYLNFATNILAMKKPAGG